MDQVEKRQLDPNLVFPTDLGATSRTVPEQTLDHVETAFSMIGGRFGHRIKYRSYVGRKNEVQTKIASYHIKMLAWMIFKSTD